MANWAVNRGRGLSIEAAQEEGRAQEDTDNGERITGTRTAAPQTGSQPLDKTMLEQIGSIGGKEVERIAVLSFRALQLYRIAVLQRKLVEIQAGLFRDKKEPDTDTDGTLRKYADAIRNYETLTQDIIAEKEDVYQFLGDNTNFQVIKRTKSGLKILEPAFNTIGSSPGLEWIGALGFRELDKRRRVEKERTAAYILRLRMALFGGAALIVPMLIMALYPGLVVDLITTSVATMFFGVVTVLMGTDSSGKDILASTAAYAAVLVVFVGASLNPG